MDKILKAVVRNSSFSLCLEVNLDEAPLQAPAELLWPGSKPEGGLLGKSDSCPKELRLECLT